MRLQVESRIASNAYPARVEWDAPQGVWRALFTDPVWWTAFLAGVAYNVFVSSVLGPLNSDEALTTVQVPAILHGQFPAWIYPWPSRYSYAGALAAYLVLPLYLITGPVDWIARAWPLVWRVGGMLLVSASLYRLRGRVAAIGGLLLAGMWPWSMGAPALMLLQHPLMTFCAYVALYYLIRAVSAPRRGLHVAPWFGLTCGVALWITPQSLMWSAAFVPAFFVCTAGYRPRWQMAAAVGLAFALGSAAWWHFNLVTSRWGTFRENVLMWPAELDSPKETLAQAGANLAYFVGPLMQHAFEPGLDPSVLHAFERPLSACAAIVAAALPVAFLATLVLTSRRRRARVHDVPTWADRERRFWWCAVAGALLLWALAVGFSVAGSTRGGVQRYLQPAFLLLPFMAAFFEPLRRPLGRIAFIALVVLLCAPAALEATRVGARWAVAERQAAEVQALAAQIEAWKATYLVGDYWDIAPFRYWSSGRIIPIAIDPALNPQISPLPPPSTGVGILVAHDALPTGAAMAARWDLASLERVDADPAFRFYRLPPDIDHPPELARLIGLAAFMRELDAWRAGQRTDLSLLGALYVVPEYAAAEDGGRLALTSSTGAGILAYGPYVALPPGRFAVEFRFDPPQPERAELTAEVISDLGAPTRWQGSLTLGPAGGTIRGGFEVGDEHARAQFETRVVVQSASGPVTLTDVRLRRVSPPTARMD